ncbi:transcription factor TFIIIB subunit brf1 [Sorochytrium milnesiophthora]
MPKIRTSRTKPPPAGFEDIEAQLREFDKKMREAESESPEGKRKGESTWPIFRLHHQRSRYIYELFYKRKAISRELYDYLLKENYADAKLVAKWKKVLEENAIVAEVAFLEASNGAAVAQGSIVSAATQGRVTAGFGKRGNATSREVTLRNAKQIITRVAYALGIGRENLIESAFQLFQMAHVHQLTRGQRTERMCCACLYIACRREHTPIMLIDFADVIQVSVFRLGTLYVHIVQNLHLESLTLQDPSIYIARFASMLEFGDKTHDVANDALRLVKRMNSDWISMGRRPAGICGACLLIAARMHNFRRTVKEIVQVVKMAEVTVNKRLFEFQSTQSAELTMGEFRESWLEGESNPPAFVRAQKQAAAEKAAADKEAAADADATTEKDPLEAVASQSAEKTAEFKLMSAEEEQELETDIGTFLNKSELQKAGEALKAKLASQAPDDGSRAYLTPMSQPVSTQGSTSDTNHANAEKYPNSKEEEEEEELQTRRKGSEKDSNDAHLSELDDDEEVSSALVTPEEAEVRSAIWHELNREFLIEEAERVHRKSQPKPPAKERKRKPRVEDGPAATTAEAARRMASKKISHKINHDMVVEIFEQNDEERLSVPGRGERKRPRTTSTSSVMSASSTTSLSTIHKGGRLTSMLQRRRSNALNRRGGSPTPSEQSHRGHNRDHAGYGAHGVEDDYQAPYIEEEGYDEY